MVVNIPPTFCVTVNGINTSGAVAATGSVTLPALEFAKTKATPATLFLSRSDPMPALDIVVPEARLMSGVEV